MSLFVRKVLPKLKTTVQLIRKGDEDIFALHTSRKLLSNTIEFELNVEFMEKVLNGKKIMSIITFQNNIMTHTQHHHAERPLVIVRNFFDDEMIETTTYGDIKCTSWYSHSRH